jgi:hypothetical protein
VTASQGHTRLERTSALSAPIPGAHGPDGLNVHMLCEDISLYLLPLRSEGEGMTVRLAPDGEELEQTVVNAFAESGYRTDLSEVIADWMKGTVHQLMRHGKAPHELARIVSTDENAENRVVGFRLVRLDPMETEEARSSLTQHVYRRTRAGRLVRETDRTVQVEHFVVCKLPPQMERNRREAMAVLQRLDLSQTTPLLLERMAGRGPPIDFGELRRAESEAVAEATRAFGWTARDLRQYNGYHHAHRQLRFERFLCELRELLVGFANEIVVKGGRLVGVEASLTVNGLPGIADVEQAEEELASGTRRFTEIVDSFRGR